MNANLVLLTQNGKQKIFPIPSTISVIGRRKNCDFRIPLDSVSRRHCQLSSHEDRLLVRDLGSRNGTFINGKKVEEQAIEPGDFLQIGPLTFAFQINGEPQKISLPKPQEKQAKVPENPSDQRPTNHDDLQDSQVDLEILDEFGDIDLDEDLADLNDL